MNDDTIDNFLNYLLQNVNIQCSKYNLGNSR